MSVSTMTNEELNAALAEQLPMYPACDYLNEIETTMAIAFERHISVHWNGSEWIATGRTRSARDANPLRAITMVLLEEPQRLRA
ncbi:hypothetical protein [Halotalea alkalilenta]|uniref:Uncharacterized protein n=1 Tax=Halotalea alkalilenta TaxID=376489 RepID=A0A172YFR4_9GAMM|nr:hypothetical protein [Halotalea alkalilenta]ANF58111.1 hypothetical protein A5892_12070 [Halotalea alkalilenta]